MLMATCISLALMLLSMPPIAIQYAWLLCHVRCSFFFVGLLLLSSLPLSLSSLPFSLSFSFKTYRKARTPAGIVSQFFHRCCWVLFCCCCCSLILLYSTYYMYKRYCCGYVVALYLFLFGLSPVSSFVKQKGYTLFTWAMFCAHLRTDFNGVSDNCRFGNLKNYNLIEMNRCKRKWAGEWGECWKHSAHDTSQSIQTSSTHTFDSWPIYFTSLPVQHNYILCLNTKLNKLVASVCVCVCQGDKSCSCHRDYGRTHRMSGISQIV